MRKSKFKILVHFLLSTLYLLETKQSLKLCKFNYYNIDKLGK